MPPLKWKPEWNALLGTATDTEIGERIGMCLETVGFYRRKLGIPRAHKTYVRVEHRVKCIICGADCVRVTYWKQARCVACRRKDWLKFKKDKLKILRHQARRYRIMMHVLGWEESQFEEMLKEIRASPMAFRRGPETRAARIDLKWERKKARAVA